MAYETVYGQIWPLKFFEHGNPVFKLNKGALELEQQGEEICKKLLCGSSRQRHPLCTFLTKLNNKRKQENLFSISIELNVYSDLSFELTTH